ncbi:MAG: hypothetical protein HQK55_00360 [Deltaproteobacteria bacterium]|nr:hypothetical protein [Deltaproteobacteria bacterium]
MPRKKNIDIEGLVAAIDAQRSSKEIMEEFKIKTLAQLKALYVDALIKAGRVPGLKSGRKSTYAKNDSPNEIRVNKRGSLIVPKEIIDNMGFTTGDSFSVRKNLAGVSLKKA